MDICSDMLVILQVMVVSVPRRFSLLVVSVAENEFTIMLPTSKKGVEAIFTYDVQKINGFD